MVVFAITFALTFGALVAAYRRFSRAWDAANLARDARLTRVQRLNGRFIGIRGEESL